MSTSPNISRLKKKLKAALRDRDPFCWGISTISDHERLLYYTHDDQIRRVDFSNAGSDDLDAMYRSCKPAEFGRNGENVFDESYRKAGKMDLVSFSTLFDPRNHSIHEQVSKALLTESLATIDVELYKLNVYGEGDFFKAHKDTPRAQNMFGSLVVVLPTLHAGGQLVLRQAEKEWTLDFANKFASATEPSVCFVAFYGDVEHEVSPVTSGYRLTLTYNLYHKPNHPSASLIPTPFYLKLKQALIDLVNDKSKLPNGGYFGFGLVHEYVHTGSNLIKPLLGQLKGSDRALADVCDELGLRYSLKLLYRDLCHEKYIRRGINLITSKELVARESSIMGDESESVHYLEEALKGRTSEEVEGFFFVEEENKKLAPRDMELLKTFYKDPVTEVLEITRMKSSVNFKSSMMTYGNEADLEFFYGTACMLIAVDPAESSQAEA